MKKLIVMALVMSLVLSVGIGIFTYADEASQKDKTITEAGAGFRKGFGMKDQKDKGFMMQDPKCMTPEEKKAKLDEAMKGLVEKGTITQEQLDSIKSFMEKRHEERKAEMEKVKAMTEEERKAYFEKAKTERKSCMEEMVAAGIITQAQADEIVKAVPRFNKPHHGKGCKRSK